MPVCRPGDRATSPSLQWHTPNTMPQLTPIKAFANTPVTKYVIACVAILSVSLSVLYLKHYAPLSLNPHILHYKQYWRIITVQLSVANESDLILCTLLWFHFKTLERFFGSAKYAALLVTLLAYNAVLTLMVLSLGQGLLLAMYAIVASAAGPLRIVYFDTIFNSVACGPLAVLSSLYICHGSYVPVSYTFRILLKKARASTEGSPPESGHATDGYETPPAVRADAESDVHLTLTNHFQVHALYTLLVFNNGMRSFLPCLVGAVVGRLYTQNLLVGSTFCLELCSKVVSWCRRIRSHPLAAGYMPISRSESPNPPATEDEEPAIDDLTQPRAMRSASPPRPLRRQFLDTFVP